MCLGLPRGESVLTSCHHCPSDLVQDKDVMIALFSGSLGLAAILLVFLGFLLTALATSRANNVASPFVETRLVWLIYSCAAFVILAVVDGLLSFAWLRWWENLAIIFDVSTALFIITIAGIVALGVQTVTAIAK